jgi:hypothetical protein
MAKYTSRARSEGEKVPPIGAPPISPKMISSPISIGHSPLDLGRTPNGIDRALELDQEAVAGVLDDAAAVLGDLRLDYLPEMRFDPLVRALLIHPHQTRIPRHVGGEDCG